ncbi:MAG: class I SAM-dependent methyltransferase [Pyrinomonadaceae bacterium]|nr:class I SAM-dependent methyltransferase [Pyrinomonadaceae bacterium]MBP6212740.1 class I SAM-dependent methyltransferase [Pyrinomonadaceae bacterium]
MTEPSALAHEAIHETVERILSKTPNGRLLDIPAGEGALAQRLKRIGYDVACCDLYPDIFRLDGVEIRSGNMDSRLPYSDAEFDAIVCVEGLEHIANPTNAIAEFSRMLKPGGHLIVSVPNIMNIEERLKWLFNGYTSHFKPLSKPVLDGISREFPGMEEIALHVNPIGYSEVRFLLEKFDFEITGTHRDKKKDNSWAFWPIVAFIRMIALFSSKKKRAERWTNELNSDEVILGGNTLIFEARKI